ncbi:MAG: hypothetical protein ACI4SO_07505 [Muribaculaceae bacterium]
MEIRFRIPMSVIYCAAIVFLLFLGIMCIKQESENSLLKRQLSCAKLDNARLKQKIEESREKAAEYKPLDIVQYKRFGE